MIVTMKEKIEPLCDRHFTLMEFDVTNNAYTCKAPGCTRAYGSLGYHNINMDTRVRQGENAMRVSFADQVRRQCPDDQTFMFVSSINRNSGEETWTCAQVDCHHSKVVRRAGLREGIAALLKSAPPGDWISMTQISDKVGSDITTVHWILALMEADGEIVSHGQPGSGIVRWRAEPIVTNAPSILDPRA